MARKIFIFIVLGLLQFTRVKTNMRLSEVFAWKELDFKFPNEQIRNMAIETEQFIPGNGIITGIEVHMDRIYLCVPRIKPGIPSTLNYVSFKEIENGTKSPVLIPYPTLDENIQQSQTSESSALVSIFRIRADACSRLWAIDTGIKDTSTSPQAETPPTIHIFDLKTDKLLFSYTLKQKTDYIEEVSLFLNIVVDVTSGNCDDAFVYLPDIGAPAIVIYSLKTNETHRITHNYFHFDPTAGDFYLSNNKHYQWQDGVYGLALSPIDKDNYRTVYFHPLASTTEFTVSTRILQNTTLTDDYLDAFRILGNRGPNSQSSISILDEETGIIFYTQFARSAVVCWNTYKGEDYATNPLGVIANDKEMLSFPNDITIDNEGYIWVLVDKQSEFIYGSVDINAINMRIFRAPIREAIKGTACD